MGDFDFPHLNVGNFASQLHIDESLAPHDAHDAHDAHEPPAPHHAPHHVPPHAPQPHGGASGHHRTPPGPSPHAGQYDHVDLPRLNLGHPADQLHIGPAPAPATPRIMPSQADLQAALEPAPDPAALRSAQPARTEPEPPPPCVDTTLDPRPESAGAYAQGVVLGECRGTRVQLGDVPPEPASATDAR
jgi:hypothetical protein